MRIRPFRLRRAALVAAIVLATVSCATKDLDKEFEQASLREILERSAKQATESHDYQAAAAAYRTLYLRDPKDTEIALNFARNLRFLGVVPQAVEVLERALKEEPENAALLAERGKVELARSRPVRALEFLDKAAERDPKDWRIFSAIGIARDLMGRYQEAQKAYGVALGLSPDNPAVLNNLALSQALSHKIDLGIATLTDLVDNPLALAQSRQNLALLHAWKGDLVTAETLARRDLPDDMVDNNLDYYRGIGNGIIPSIPPPVTKSVPIPPPPPAGKTSN